MKDVKEKDKKEKIGKYCPKKPHLQCTSYKPSECRTCNIIRTVILAIIMLISLIPILPVKVAFALQNPISLTILTTQITRDNIEANDQLYIIPFTIGSCNTTEYTATQLFTIRLLNNGIEIASGKPYAFYNDGFSSGAIGFYFSPSDSNLPTWESSNLTVEIIGSPLISWDSGIPYTSSNSFEWRTTSSYVGIKIRYLADQFTSDWGIELTSVNNGLKQFTSYGESYFNTTIPFLSTIFPSLYVAGQSSPVFAPTANQSPSYQEQLMNERLNSASGNVTEAAGLIGGIDPPAFLTLIWIVGGICFIALIGYGSYKINPDGSLIRSPIMIRGSLAIFSIWMIFGTALKYVILGAGIGIACVAVLGIVFTFFFKGSSY